MDLTDLEVRRQALTCIQSMHGKAKALKLLMKRHEVTHHGAWEYLAQLSLTFVPRCSLHDAALVRYCLLLLSAGISH